MQVRLNLALRVGAADLSWLGRNCEGLTMFLLAEGPHKATARSTHAWVAPQKIVACKRNAEQPPEGELSTNGVRYFSTRILANMVSAPLKERKIAPGQWNNVVARTYRHNARNFAIGTGRKGVLRPIGRHTFDPKRDYAYFPHAFPTELVFFSLFALMREGSSFVDILTKDTYGSLDELMRVEELNWLKIVLIYRRSGTGWELEPMCYVDGLATPVQKVRVTDPRWVDPPWESAVPGTPVADDDVVDDNSGLLGSDVEDALDMVRGWLQKIGSVIRDSVTSVINVVPGVTAVERLLKSVVDVERNLLCETAHVARDLVTTVATAAEEAAEETADAIDGALTSLFGGDDKALAAEDHPGDVVDPYE